MTEKLNQFVSNLNGQFIELSSRENIYQCMDLVYAWIFCLGYPKATIQHLYAYEVFTKPSDLTYKYFDLIPNTPDFIPQDGDIGVFKGGVAGHIVVCLGGGTTSMFRRFEQNNPIGTNASINNRGYTNMLGVLRPKVFSSTKPLIYKGYDIHNDDSNKVAVDKLVDIMEGKYISIDEHTKIINGLDSKSTEQAKLYEIDKQKITDELDALRESYKKLLDEDSNAAKEADMFERKLKSILQVLKIDISVESDESVLDSAVRASVDKSISEALPSVKPPVGQTERPKIGTINIFGYEIIIYKQNG